ANVVEKQRAACGIKPEQAEKEPEVTDASHDESFFGSRRSTWFVIPKPDQQVGGKANQLPAHEKKQKTIGDDQAQHGGGEERHETKKAREILIVGHVADAVDKNERADEGDHHEHASR